MPRLLVTGMGGASGYAVGRIARDLGLDVRWGDHDPLTPALLLRSDAGMLMPAAGADDFLDRLAETCGRYGITHISPNVDAEIARLGAKEAGAVLRPVTVWLPPPDSVAICQDKLLFARFLEERAPEVAPRRFADAVAASRDFPALGVMVKPRRGSGGKGIVHCTSPTEVEIAVRARPDSIIQEALDGEEFSADCLSDPGAPSLVHLRRRLRTRAGMSTVTESFIDETLQKQVGAILDDLAFGGPSCVQGFRTPAGYRITEINVRFGGGCALAEYSGGQLITTYLKSLLTGAPYPADSFAYRAGAMLVRTLDFDYIPGGQP